MTEPMTGPIGRVELEPTFSWMLDLATESETFGENFDETEVTASTVFHSPSFWSADLKMINHQWRLEIKITTSDPNSGYGYIDQVALNHLDDQVFVVNDLQLRIVVGPDSETYTESEVYNNMVSESRSNRMQRNQQYNRAATSSTSNPLSKTFSKENSRYTVQVGRKRFRFPSKLTIFCRIIVPSLEASTDPLAIFGKSTMSQHSNDLKKDYESLLLQNNFSDITIHVAKKELHLNKSIISKRSPVFAAMFNHQLKENETNIVSIEDFTYEVMLEFFRFIYAAEVKNIESYMTDLFVAAEKYAVDGLKSLCEKSMVKSLNPENALEYLCMANRYNAKNLENQCLKYIVLNAKDIVKSPEYDLSHVPKDVVNKLFSSLAMKSEIMWSEIV